MMRRTGGMWKKAEDALDKTTTWMFDGPFEKALLVSIGVLAGIEIVAQAIIGLAGIFAG